MSFSQSKNQPLVSVCLLTYQHVAYIEQCLDSVLMQKTNFPFEIILGEDESSDGTRKICQEYAEKYPGKIKLFLRFRKDVIYIDGKATGRYNFVESLKSCPGKYVAILDGDDYWTDPLKLQKQVDALESDPDVGICFHNVQIFDQKKQQLLPDTMTRDISPISNIDDLAKGNYIHTPSVMLRNDYQIPSWFSDSPIGDWTIYMIAIKDRKVKKLNDCMAAYRLHDSSLWSGLSSDVRKKKTILSVKLVMENISLNKKTQQVLQKRIRPQKNVLSVFWKKIKQRYRGNN